jgi:hypothetical protein
MSDFLDPIEAWIVGRMEQGTGSRPLTSGRFRRSASNAPLRDLNYPPNIFDRGYELEWQSDEDFGAPYNAKDGAANRLVMLAMNIGYVSGPGASGNVDTTGSEVAATAVLNARKRAISEAAMIQRAFMSDPTSSSGGVEWAMMKRDGATAIEDLGGGRILSVTRWPILVTIDPATNHSP